jgi:hypothetical protein
MQRQTITPVGHSFDREHWLCRHCYGKQNSDAVWFIEEQEADTESVQCSECGAFLALPINGPLYNIGDKVTIVGRSPTPEDGKIGTVTETRMIGPVRLGVENTVCQYQHIRVDYEPIVGQYSVRSHTGAAKHFTIA